MRDTGCGMSPDTLERIFEPYFTTKEVGEGSGLGLAVVHSIVQGLDGAILVSSEPGAGTEFVVYLPVLQTGGGEVSPQPDTMATAGGTERILFVVAPRHSSRSVYRLGGADLLERLRAHQHPGSSVEAAHACGPGEDDP